MEKYKFKNPYPTLLTPTIGLVSIVLFYPQIKAVPLIIAFPILIMLIGSYIAYRKFSFRIILDDSSIKIRDIEIPWDKVTKAISSKQLVDSGNSTTIVKVISIVYMNDMNKRKIISITPRYMNKPIALVNSIKKRIEIVPMDKISQ